MLARTKPCAKRAAVLGRSEIADSDRRMLLYRRIGRVGCVGSRYPLASLLSSVDVHRCDHTRPSRESVGVFDRNLSRWAVGLCQHLCNNFLLQWAATGFSMGSDGAFDATGSTYRRACVVFKSVGRSRMSLGVFSTPNKISPRRRQLRNCFRFYNRIFRLRHGSISASLSQPFPSNLAPTSALIGLMGTWRKTGLDVDQTDPLPGIGADCSAGGDSIYYKLCTPAGTRV